MIRFEHPQWLQWMWLAAALLSAAAYVEYRWRVRAMREWAKNEQLWDVVLPHRSPGRLFLKRMLLVGAGALLCIAIANPQIGTRLTEVTREGVDVVLAVDFSQSMYAEDLTPNRLSKARYEIARFMEQLRGDRVALVPFARVAWVEVPLTEDYGAIMSKLNAITPDIVPHQGTSLAATIRQARRVFRGESKAQRIIVLITDGEDHEADAVKEAREANQREGIIIYTIGMASLAGAPIPLKDSRGNTVGYVQENGSRIVMSKRNEKLLMEIAAVSGGEYYRADQNGGEFKQLYRAMTKLEKEKYETKQYTDYEDRFQYLAAAALLLMVLEELIPPRRRRRL